VTDGRDQSRAELLSDYGGTAGCAMLVITGLVLAAAGALAAAAGLADMRRVSQLRRRGVKAWATVVGRPAAVPFRDEDGGPPPVALRFSLADGRIVEHVLPHSAKSQTHEQGRVLIWYDPGNPADVLVYGHPGRRGNAFFLALGCVTLVGGLVIASLAH